MFPSWIMRAGWLLLSMGCSWLVLFGCKSDHKVSRHGPQVTWRETRATSDSAELPTTEFHIEGRTNPVRVPQCESFGAELNQERTVLGVRCCNAGKWHEIALASNADIQDCTPSLGPGPRPDFSKARSFPDVVIERASCGKGIHQAAEMLRATGYSERIETLLVRTIYQESDEWGAELETLDAPERLRVQAALEKELVVPDLPQFVLTRLVPSRLSENAKKMLATRLDNAASKTATAEIEALVQLVAPNAPAIAARNACRLLAEGVKSDVLLSAIQSAKESCPALSPKP